MNMKKLVISLFLALAVFFTFSCDMYYPVNKKEIARIKSKTTYKSFDHLEEPIVIAMTVYDNRYLFGNKNLASKRKVVGDVIVIVDIETNTVFDWVFNPNGQGYSAWRLIEMGKEKTKYYQSSPATRTIAVVDPEKTKLSFVNSGVSDNLWNKNEKADYGAFSTYERQGENVYGAVYIFDTVNQKMDEHNPYLIKDTFNLYSVPHMRCDEDSNLWFQYNENKKFYFSYIDCKKHTLHDKVLSFNNNENYNYDETADYCFNKLRGINNDYIFISEEFQNNDVVLTSMEVLIYDRKKLLLGDYSQEDLQPIRIKIDLDNLEFNPHIYSIEQYQNKNYAICPCGIGDNHIYFFELDIENEKAVLINEITFDMTDGVYERDNKIYLMNSRDVNDIQYLYFDTTTNTFSEQTRIKLEDVLKIK